MFVVLSFGNVYFAYFKTTGVVRGVYRVRGKLDVMI